MQALAKWRIELAVTEPYYIPPDRSNWMGDTTGLITIVGPHTADSLPLLSV